MKNKRRWLTQFKGVHCSQIASETDVSHSDIAIKMNTFLVERPGNAQNWLVLF